MKDKDLRMNNNENIVNVNPGKKTILLIEDDEAVAKGLQYGLEDEGFTVIHEKLGLEGLAKLQKSSVHILLLDIRLPDISGFDLCKKIREKAYKLPILMLTARDEEVDKILGLELGADDYIIKPFSFRELVSRIRAHLRRSYGNLSDTAKTNVYAFDSIKFDLENMKLYKLDSEIQLTPIELKILKALIQSANNVINREKLIELVWGYNDYFGDPRTVDVHIRHLREKLEDNPNEPKWIQTVRGFGYKFNLH